jgi:hypothetical protein
LEEGCAKATLKLITRAFARTVSIIAAASSSAVALGVSVFPDEASAKIGRTSKVQLGQMAGAWEPLFAAMIPATNVP